MTVLENGFFTCPRHACRSGSLFALSKHKLVVFLLLLWQDQLLCWGGGGGGGL